MLDLDKILGIVMANKCILHDYKPVREVKKPVLADGIFGFKRPKVTLYECSQCEERKWVLSGL